MSFHFHIVHVVTGPLGTLVFECEIRSCVPGNLDLIYLEGFVSLTFTV
jgi:hypothetical protein